MTGEENHASSLQPPERARPVLRALMHPPTCGGAALAGWMWPGGIKRLPETVDLLARLASVAGADKGDDQIRLQFLLLWSIIEAAARHRLSSLKIPPTRRISSSALLKMLLTEGIIEEDQYAVLRRGLAVRNAIAHGFLNQPVDAALFEELRQVARGLLPSGSTISVDA
jgi:uncharacterized protein YutE (UPF0331/DUF86 family)